MRLRNKSLLIKTIMSLTLFIRKQVIVFLIFSSHLSIQAQWRPIGSTDDIVNDFEVYDNLLLMGGRFNYADNNQAKSLAFWTEGLGNNKGKWDEYAAISGWIYDMIIFQNDLYVSGDFAYVNLDPMSKIAKFNGSSWSQLGTSGVNGTFTQGSSVAIHSMAVFLGELYAGGTFTAASGVSQTKNIAKWDGTSWTSVGGGILAQQYDGVRKLYVYNGELYAAGSFSVAGGVSVTNTAKWDGSSWTAFADFGQTGFGPASVIDFVEYNGDLYAAGNFSVVNGIPVNRIARFDGLTWSDASNGMYASAAVSALAVYNNELYASGYFNVAGSSKTNNIVKWNGTTWKSFGSVSNGNVEVLSVQQGSLFAGGFFNAIGDSVCINVARYSPQNLVGIENEDLKNNTLSPNPFSVETILNSEKDLSTYNFYIFDLSGQKVRSYIQPEGRQLNIKRRDLPPGIYFLKIEGMAGEVSITKLVICED